MTKTIELNEQQVDLLKAILTIYVEDEKFLLSETSRAIIKQILEKLHEDN